MKTEKKETMKGKTYLYSSFADFFTGKEPVKRKGKLLNVTKNMIGEDVLTIQDLESGREFQCTSMSIQLEEVKN